MIVGQKKCSKCGEVKLLEEYNKKPSGKDGKQAHCRACCSAANQKRYADNLGKIKEQHRQWAENNSEKRREDNHRWRKNNSEKLREKEHARYITNHEKIRVQQQKWRETHVAECQERLQRWRKSNPEKWRAYVRNKQDENYSGLCKIFGSACLDCGREYPMPVFDYHHIDPKTKIGKLRIASWKWERVASYIQGCVQLCPTCHRLRHLVGCLKRPEGLGAAKCC